MSECVWGCRVLVEAGVGVRCQAGLVCTVGG